MSLSVVVTGASGDLGRELALHHAAPGTTLCLFGRNRERLTETADLCKAKGATVASHIADVVNMQLMTKLLLDHDNAHPVDRLYVNAGISGSVGADQKSEAVDQLVAIMSVNATAAMATAAAILDRMRQRGTGQIVFVASLAALYGFPNTPAYSASKSAILTYGLALRRLACSDRVGITVACPGFIESAMSRRVDGPKPLMVTASEAAGRIVRGADGNRATVMFPIALWIGITLLKLLPPILQRPFLRLFHYDVRG
jgi:short-subunit dehydrogenase